MKEYSIKFSLIGRPTNRLPALRCLIEGVVLIGWGARIFFAI